MIQIQYHAFRSSPFGRLKTIRQSSHCRQPFVKPSGYEHDPVRSIARAASLYTQAKSHCKQCVMSLYAQAHTQRHSRTHAHTDTDRQTDRQTGRQPGRQAGRQTDRQTDTRTNTRRHTQTRTDAHRHTHTHTLTITRTQPCVRDTSAEARIRDSTHARTWGTYHARTHARVYYVHACPCRETCWDSTTPEAQHIN